MQVVKVLQGAEITLPEEIINTPGIKEGDILIIEKTEEGIALKKGKTIYRIYAVLYPYTFLFNSCILKSVGSEKSLLYAYFSKIF